MGCSLISCTSVVASVTLIRATPTQLASGVSNLQCSLFPHRDGSARARIWLEAQGNDGDSLPARA
ncbi:hypothetical protein U9M48_011658 [Paspalum notatum var. saurae]|uniref:Uncharacterized protein n=1 Tax=Paspalum notatum var. saurae TaxID=547442 RepID=A0AAQ3SVW2_PASNO